MYLELDVARADASPLTATGWFLRPSDLEAASRALVDAGFTVSGPELYEGHDGRWADVSLTDGGLAGASPILTVRVDTPPGSWPPQTAAEHANGVAAIGALELETPDPERAMQALSALGAARSAAGMTLVDGSEVRLRHDSAAHATRLVTLHFRRRRGDDLVVDVAPPFSGENR